jgi:SNF2 family DNA or RNA helicase
MQHSASDRIVDLGSLRKRELQRVVGKYLLQRTKEGYLQDELLGKDVQIVYCELTPLQKQVHLMFNSTIIVI